MAAGNGQVSPLIRTPRLTLRLPEQRDCAEFIRAMRESADHLRPWSPRLPEAGADESFFAATFSRARQEWDAGTGVRLLAFLADGTLAGTFNLNNIVRGVFQNADAGWSVMSECVGSGIATEGVKAMLGLAFRAEPLGLGLHRVQANVIPGNAASLRVAHKCGFREEGLARRMLMIDGRWQDHVMFAKLAEEHADDQGAA